MATDRNVESVRALEQENESLRKQIDAYERGLISTPYTRALVAQATEESVRRYLEVIRLNRVVARQAATIKAMRRDARLGRAVMSYIDRMNDLTPEDNADVVLGEFTREVNTILRQNFVPMRELLGKPVNACETDDRERDDGRC